MTGGEADEQCGRHGRRAPARHAGRQCQDEASRRRQRGAEAREDLFERRHDPNQQGRCDREREQQHGNRISERASDPCMLGGRAFAIVGEPREHLGERARRFADRDQLAEERIELARVAAQGGGELPSCNDLPRESCRDAGHFTSLRRLREQFERRREREPRMQESCELTRETCDVACARAGLRRRAARFEMQHRDAHPFERRARGGRIDGDQRAAASRAIGRHARPAVTGLDRRGRAARAHPASVAPSASSRLVVPSRTRASAASRKLVMPSACACRASSALLARATIRLRCSADSGITW